MLRLKGGGVSHLKAEPGGRTMPCPTFLLHAFNCGVGAKGPGWSGGYDLHRLQHRTSFSANGLAHCMCLHVNHCWLTPCGAHERLVGVGLASPTCAGDSGMHTC